MTRRAILRILVVDDHPVVRAGLRAVLGRERDMRVVAEAASLAEAVSLLPREAPDVVLLDLRLPDASGADAIAAILAAHPGQRVLVVSSYSRAGDIRSALEAGALGYVAKEVADTELVGAVRKIGAGGSSISLAPASGQSAEGFLERLTAREQQVLEMMADGRSNDEIARALGLSIGTVKNFVHAILLKLRVTDRTAAVAAATRSGLLRPR